MLRPTGRTGVEQHHLEAGTDVDRRRSLGIYYTPSGTADILARWAIRNSKDTVLEPSFGGCALLRSAVARLREVGCEHPANQLRGFDIDGGAFAYLQRLLGDDQYVGQFNLQDFLVTEATSQDHRVTTILANPPFVSYHRMNRAQREVIRMWRARHSAEFPMTASLWAYFLVHSLSFLSKDGRIAFVLPAAATTARYAKPIFDQLTTRFERVVILRVSEQLFIDAGAAERTVVLLAEGYQARASTRKTIDIQFVASLEALDTAVDALTCNTINSNESSLREDCAGLLGTLGGPGNFCRFADVVDVKIGEVIGDTPFFVKTRDEWGALGIDDRYLRLLVTRSRHLSGLRLSRRDTTSRYSPIPYLLRPPESRLPKRLQHYLESYPSQAKVANRTFAKREPWYAVPYDSSGRAFFASMSHRLPRIVLNSANVSCANGLYKLAARRGVAWRAGLAPAALCTVTLLCAELIARARGDGALKLEPSDVKQLIVPTTYQRFDARRARDTIDRIDKLIRAGRNDDATQAADQTFILAPGILTRAELAKLTQFLWQLRSERMS